MEKRQWSAVLENNEGRSVVQLVVDGTAYLADGRNTPADWATGRQFWADRGGDAAEFDEAAAHVNQIREAEYGEPPIQA